MISHTHDTFTIENLWMSRTLRVDAEGLRTVSMVNKANGREYVRRLDRAEFQLSLNRSVVRSFQKAEPHIVDGNIAAPTPALAFLGHQSRPGRRGSEILELRFRLSGQPVEIKVSYESYADLPGMAKWLDITCLSGEMHLSKLFFEMLNLCPGPFVDAEYFRQHGTVPSKPMFAACGDDDIIQVHDLRLSEGFWVGNGAPGPLRYFLVYPEWPECVACGYSMSSGDFHKYLGEGQTFSTDKAYVYLYQGARDSVVHRNRFREWIRRELPDCPDPGGVMYCTWLPFLKKINDALLGELIGQAADMGFRSFVVDDGWFVPATGEVDPAKFPHGLEAISARVKAVGMRFGLWVNIGSDYGAIGLRPGDNALDSRGEPKSPGFGGTTQCRCLASHHRDVLVEQLCRLAERYGVDYFKLDFSSMVSPYGIIPLGCTATAHAYHRDASDALQEQYAALQHVREAVKKRAPGVMLDFSFEAFGPGSPSIAALRFSEWHHASNLNTVREDVYNGRKIRNILYGFSTLLPNERILGSLICLHNRDDIENLLTSFIGAPLVAGDLRLITPAGRAAITAICANLNALLRGGPLTEFCPLRGDRPIGPRDWDGFARYRRDGSGLLCLFRNESGVGTATAAIPDIPAEFAYRFIDGITGTDLGCRPGAAWREGISFDIPPDPNCRVLFFSPGAKDQDSRGQEST
jgi:hypothetical protein